MAIPANTTKPAAIAARQRLQAILEKLDPTAGIPDDGDASCRHKGRFVHSKKKPKG